MDCGMSMNHPSNQKTLIELQDELDGLNREGSRAAKSRPRELEAARIEAELKHDEAIRANWFEIIRMKCAVVAAMCELIEINRQKSMRRKKPPVVMHQELIENPFLQFIDASQDTPPLPSPPLLASPEPVAESSRPPWAAASGSTTTASPNASPDASPNASPDASPNASPDASLYANPDASPHTSLDANPAPIACSGASVTSESSVATASGHPNDSTFNCPICLVEVEIENVFLVDSCEHRMCRDCVRQMILKALRSGTVPVSCPSCQSEPCPKCPEKTSAPGASLQKKRCTLSQGDVETVLTEEEFLRFLSATLNASVNNSGGSLVRCPDGECSGVLEIPDDRVNFLCPVCVRLWCRNCEVEWHENMTCEEFQLARTGKEEDTAMMQMLNEGRIKRCPKCQQHGMKEESEECNAITCQSCKCSFCWLCLKDLSHYKDLHSHFAEPGQCFGKCFYGLPGHENTI
ncbi:hypothetical protein BSKO_12911 [Bryopsis sp. KO-2023]|nr:hypothetical protein BSKO_12911 [Bryopsis sp. KO-2023]